MYKHFTTPVCFIGENTLERFSLTCLLFQKDGNIEFIEWVNWMNAKDELPPLDKERPITLKEYIMNNGRVSQTLKRFRNPNISTNNSGKIINKMLRELMKDDEIMMRKEVEESANKYNL